MMNNVTLAWSSFDRHIVFLTGVYSFYHIYVDAFDPRGYHSTSIICYIGKTLLAKAVANQTSATFLRVCGSELIQKYLGEGPKLVRELFRVAEEHAPSIVFIDEIDAIGTKRSATIITCIVPRKYYRKNTLILLASNELLDSFALPLS